MAEAPCPQCGKVYPYEDEICPACGYQVEAPPVREERRTYIAAFLSIFFFGGGQVYNDQIPRAIVFLVSTLIGILVFILPGILVWIYGIYDAVVTTSRMNMGRIPYRPVKRGILALYIFIVLLIYVAFGVIAAGYARTM